MKYTVSGNQLITHVELGEDVQFPVLVDPNIVAVGYGGNAGWPRWNEFQSCDCFDFLNTYAGFGLGTKDEETEIPGGVSSSQYGEWYINPDGGSVVKLTRVDIQGAQHVPWTSNASSSFGAWIYQGG